MFLFHIVLKAVTSRILRSLVYFTKWSWFKLIAILIDNLLQGFSLKIAAIPSNGIFLTAFDKFVRFYHLFLIRTQYFFL